MEAGSFDSASTLYSAELGGTGSHGRSAVLNPAFFDASHCMGCARRRGPFPAASRFFQWDPAHLLCEPDPSFASRSLRRSTSEALPAWLEEARPSVSQFDRYERHPHSDPTAAPDRDC